MGINEEDCLCSKCGKVQDEDMLKVDLGQAGYDSAFDGSFVRFNVCDNCLIEFKSHPSESYNFPDYLDAPRKYDDFLYRLVKSFPLEHQEPILNSGSNTYLSSEDWIRYESGEISDIEKHEMGLSV